MLNDCKVSILLRACTLLVLLNLNVACSLLAQEDPAPAPAPQLTDEELALKPLLEDPRETMRTFLSAMESGDLEQAVKCLDLEWLDKETSDVKGGVYADKLFFVLTRIWDRRTYNMSGNPDHPSPFQLSDLLPNEFEPQKQADADLIQMAKNAKGMWRFTRPTLEVVEEKLWSKWQEVSGDDGLEVTALSAPVWLANQFPKSLQETHFLLKDYQWICLLLLTVCGFLIGRLSRIILDWVTALWFRIVHAQVDDQPRLKLWQPVSLLINALTWYYGAKLIDLPAGFLGVLLVGLKFFSIVIAVWTAFRFINLLASFLQRRASATASRYDDSIVPILRNLLKVAAVLVGLILFIDVFQLDWKTVIGGFGVGGIALALASKEVLSNFLGSITVLTDRPFEIGDLVSIDGKVTGTVETVGMRSSRIRTANSSEVVVPNSLLTTAIVDNLGRRTARRFSTVLQVDYHTTVDQIEAFCAGIRQIVQNNPYMKNETTYVYLQDFAESAINLLVNVGIETSSYETELRERHCLLRDILRLAEDLKVQFAFPTRTLHIRHDDENAKQLPTTPEELAKFGRAAANRIGKPESNTKKS